MSEAERERIRILEQRLTAAERDAQKAWEVAQITADAIAFYADFDTYFAIEFFPDPPCGEFMDDFSPDPGTSPERQRPGKRAREAFEAFSAALAQEPKALIHDIERHVAIAAELSNECESARACLREVRGLIEPHRAGVTGPDEHIVRALALIDRTLEPRDE